MPLPGSIAKLPNLQLKIQPKQLLVELPLDIAPSNKMVENEQQFCDRLK